MYIIGNTGVGKTMVFNALTGSRVDEYEKKVNIATMNIYDERIEDLKKIYEPKIISFVQITIYDKPSFSENSQDVRFSDGYIIVIGDIPQVKESQQEQLDSIFADLYLSDISVLQKRYDLITKGKKKSEMNFEANAIEELLQMYKNEKYLFRDYKNEEKRKLMKGFQLYFLKPIIVIVNSENKTSNIMNDHGFPMIVTNAKEDVEINALSDEERQEYCKELDIQPLSVRFLGILKELNNWISFFTCSEKEVKVWKIERERTIHEAAGLIHTDIQNGFIKAEVINYDDLVKYGDEKNVKQQGLCKIEGRNYIMKDGDIIYIKFK